MPRRRDRLAPGAHGLTRDCLPLTESQVSNTVQILLGVVAYEVIDRFIAAG